MESNKFEITGKITYVDIKYKESGMIYTKVLMSKKNMSKENEYDTYSFVFFGETAEQFAEKIKKGDYANIVGRVGVSKFTKDGKEISKYELYGNEFTKVVYDENLKRYVPATNETTTQQSDEEIPWET